jgi:hypothetical protein
MMDVWSLEMLSVPSFFLYAADPLIFWPALEDAIAENQTNLSRLA